MEGSVSSSKTSSSRSNSRTETANKVALCYGCSSMLSHQKVTAILSKWLERHLNIDGDRLNFRTQEYQIQAVTLYYIMNEKKEQIWTTRDERARLHIDIDGYFEIEVLHWDLLSWIFLEDHPELEPLIDQRGMVVVDQSRLNGWSPSQILELQASVNDTVSIARSKGSVAFEGEGMWLLEEIGLQWNWNTRKIKVRRPGSDRVPIGDQILVMTPPEDRPFQSTSRQWLLDSLIRISRDEPPMVIYRPSPALKVEDEGGYNKLEQLAINAFKELARLNNQYLRSFEDWVHLGSDGVLMIPSFTPRDLHNFASIFESLRSSSSEIPTQAMTRLKSSTSSKISIRPCRLDIEDTGAMAFFDDGTSVPLIELEEPSQPQPQHDQTVQNLWKNGHFITLWGHYLWNMELRASLYYCREPLRYKNWSQLIEYLGV